MPQKRKKQIKRNLPRKKVKGNKNKTCGKNSILKSINKTKPLKKISGKKIKKS